MEIKAAIGDISKAKAGATLVTYYEDAKSPEAEAAIVDKALGGTIAVLIKQGDIKGKLNEVNIIYGAGKLAAGRVAVLGLGKKKEMTLDKVRGAFAEACRYLRGKGAADVAAITVGEGINGIKSLDAIQAMTEGAILGLYTFKRHITKKEDNNKEIKSLTIYVKEKAAADKAIAQGKIIAEAACFTRDLVNEPSNFMTPGDLAAEAKKVAKKYELGIEIFEKEKIKEMGMGGLMAVSRGSQEPPKFIVLTYKGRASKDIDVALVGKGITFDSGGISLKPSDHMEDMKGDMAGAASVMGAIAAIAQIKPKINVTAFMPATENMPSGSAQKPGDVFSALNGKTVEVTNTDAEGRLILADALSYAAKLGAKSIIDVATLTGACQVALGNICTGAFTNDQALLDKVLAAGKAAGEPAWQMPMLDEYKELIKSDVADMKNAGSRYGGAISAAKFLEEFVGKTPWVHLDIAGTSSTEKEKGYQTKGGTGVPVRTFVNFVLNEAKK